MGMEKNAKGHRLKINQVGASCRAVRASTVRHAIVGPGMFAAWQRGMACDVTDLQYNFSTARRTSLATLKVPGSKVKPGNAWRQPSCMQAHVPPHERTVQHWPDARFLPQTYV